MDSQECDREQDSDLVQHFRTRAHPWTSKGACGRAACSRLSPTWGSEAVMEEGVGEGHLRLSPKDREDEEGSGYAKANLSDMKKGGLML